jgi:hypothetical protein
MCEGDLKVLAISVASTRGLSANVAFSYRHAVHACSRLCTIFSFQSYKLYHLSVVSNRIDMYF